MTGSLADDHYARIGLSFDQWVSQRDIAVVLAEMAGLDALLEGDERGGALVLVIGRHAALLPVIIRGVHDDSGWTSDGICHDSRARGRRARPLPRCDRCCHCARSRRANLVPRL